MDSGDTIHLVLTVEETRQLLRLSRGATYGAIRSGTIPSIRVGHRILIPKRGLERLLAASVTGAEAPISDNRRGRGQR